MQALGIAHVHLKRKQNDKGQKQPKRSKQKTSGLCWSGFFFNFLDTNGMTQYDSWVVSCPKSHNHANRLRTALTKNTLHSFAGHCWCDFGQTFRSRSKWSLLKETILRSRVHVNYKQNRLTILLIGDTITMNPRILSPCILSIQKKKKNNVFCLLNPAW